MSDTDVKINGGQSATAAVASQKKAPRSGKPEVQPEVLSSDRVELSRLTTLINKLESAYDQLPDEAQQRVAELKNRVEAGNYETNAADIAEALLAKASSRPDE